MYESLLNVPGGLLAEFERLQRELQDDFAFVAQANIGGEFMQDTDIQRLQVIGKIFADGNCYGQQAELGKKVLVEFVSANPTGPLHVGHGRQAALGDALSNILKTQGWSVHKEFYYNDAGVQITNLAASVHARLSGLKPGDASWPEQAYNGEYIADIAAEGLEQLAPRAMGIG